jgi:hypothetical protein
VRPAGTWVQLGCCRRRSSGILFVWPPSREGAGRRTGTSCTPVVRRRWPSPPALPCRRRAGTMEGGRQAEVAKAILSSKNVPYVVAAPLLIQVLLHATRSCSTAAVPRRPRARGGSLPTAAALLEAPLARLSLLSTSQHASGYSSSGNHSLPAPPKHATHALTTAASLCPVPPGCRTWRAGWPTASAAFSLWCSTRCPSWMAPLTRCPWGGWWGTTSTSCRSGWRAWRAAYASGPRCAARRPRCAASAPRSPRAGGGLGLGGGALAMRAGEAGRVIPLARPGQAAWMQSATHTRAACHTYYLRLPLGLPRSPAQDRKLAILVYGFPPGVGATGTAALLNVPKSLEAVLRKLREVRAPPHPTPPHPTPPHPTPPHPRDPAKSQPSLTHTRCHVCRRATAWRTRLTS